MSPQKSKDFKSKALAFIEKHSQGLPGNSLHLTTKLIIICDNSINKALILSQLLYWCDRGAKANGWFYKSQKELHEETRIDIRAIRRHVQWFKDEGFLETRLKKVKGWPTTHFHINYSEFYLFCERKIKEYSPKK